MCEECTQKLTQEFVDVQDRLKKATEKFEKGITKLQIRDELHLDGYTFTEIVKQYHILGPPIKTTKKEVFEWEFYTILKSLLEVCEAFESGRRNALKEPDYRELLGNLKYNYDLLKRNIKYLEED